ncbi:MAG: choice-of-anchor B family protein [Flavobacteriaceae bacterium]|nr:choice-of-anchor B family protein [Flavobacteriaceae bacterium]
MYMKKIIYLLPFISLFLFINACTSSPDFSETITIIDGEEIIEEEEDEQEEEEEEEEEEDQNSGPETCQNGFAGIYPCNDYDLISHISIATFGSEFGNDCWGWTDPQTGKEYAIMGLNDGTAIVDISDAPNPIYIGKIPSTGFSESIWRDIKVYNNHVFIVSEDPNHGMQIYDLTHLRDVNDPPVALLPDTTYDGFGDAHNIAINEESGFAYAVGADNSSTQIINIQNPLNSTIAGPLFGGFSHDAQVITYQGPDVAYQGHEIFVGCNASNIVIIDVTDKNNPENIASFDYPDITYAHQGWFTEDHKYFIITDELDEIDFGFNSKLIIFDLSNLENPLFHFNYFGNNTSTDHNGYVKGNKYFLSSYTSGLRVMSIENIGNSAMNEVGYFDTFPSNNNAGYDDGVWGVYPYFESGNIVLSDINSGLFIVKKQ